MSFVSNDALRVFSGALGAGHAVWNVDEARVAMAGLGDLDPDRTEAVLEQLQTLRPVDETDRTTIGTLCALLLRIDEAPGQVPATLPATLPARRARSGPGAVPGLPQPEEPPAPVPSPSRGEDPDPEEAVDGVMECLRCGTTMESLDPDTHFQRGGAFGEDLAFDLIVCPSCGKVEFFMPDQADQG